MVLLFIFQNNILSFLVSKKFHRIETFEQLLYENNIKVLVVNNSQEYRLLTDVMNK